MTENAKTEVPYPVICGYGEFMVDVPGLFLKSKNEEDAKMWSEAFNAAYAAGRASRDDLRKELESQIDNWSNVPGGPDHEADADDPSPKNAVSHLAGLCIRAIKDVLDKDEKDGK